MTSNLARQVFLVFVVLEPCKSQVLAQLAAESVSKQAGFLAAGLVLSQAVDRDVTQELCDTLRRPNAFVDKIVEVNAGEEGVRLYLIAAL